MIGFIEWDDRLRVKSWSKRAEAIFGWNEQELIGLHKNGYSLVFEDDLPMVSPGAMQLMAGTVEENSFQHRNYTKDGRVIWCEWFNSLLRDKYGAVTGILSQVQDITAQKKATEKVITTSHFYALISQVNQAITHSSDEQTVLKKACTIACEFGKLKTAWISSVDEAGRRLVLLHQCNLSPERMVLLQTISYENDGPVNLMIKTGNSFIAGYLENDRRFENWGTLISRGGWASCMVLPIKKSGRVVASFHLVSAEVDFFTQEVAALLKEATGDISSAVAGFEEEKNRKRLREEALHRALRLNQAQAIAHMGSWEISFSTGILVWSEEARRIYGLSPEDQVQSYESWLSYIHPEDLEDVLKTTQDSQETLTGAGFSHRIVRQDGTVRDLYSRAEFYLDLEGKPIGLYGISHDITEIKRGEKALAQSEANLRQIMDLLPQYIFARNIHGNYVFINQSFAGLHGLKAEDLIAQPLTKTLPSSTSARYFLKQDQAVIATGEKLIEPEYSFTDWQQKLRTFRIEKVPFTIAGSGEKAILGIMMDITEQKKLDLEHAKMTADILQRNTDLEQFSYIISHNLRAPVANISGITNILQNGSLEVQEEAALLEKLALSTKKLDTVIMDLNDILELNHKEQKQKERVNFAGLVKDISASLANQVRAYGATVNSDFSAAGEMLTVKSYLYSIFFNLIANSIKYRRPGISPVIRISSEIRDGCLQIWFKDNGLGIDLSKYGGEVFGLYKRFHNHVDGKGMGLYLVKTEVELLGGLITVSSEVNRGATFLLTFDGH